MFTWDAATIANGFWLIADYLPEIADREASLPDAPRITALLEALGRTVRSEVVAVPADCTDGFGAAYWRRPEAYLDPQVQASMSGLALLDPDVRSQGLARLAADLDSGAWHRRHGDLLGSDSLDCGYRLLIATPA